MKLFILLKMHKILQILRYHQKIPWRNLTIPHYFRSGTAPEKGRACGGCWVTSPPQLLSPAWHRGPTGSPKTGKKGADGGQNFQPSRVPERERVMRALLSFQKNKLALPPSPTFQNNCTFICSDGGSLIIPLIVLFRPLDRNQLTDKWPKQYN